MRVLLDTTFASRAPHSGTGVYLARLQSALDARDDVEVIPVSNRRRRPGGGGGVRSARNFALDAWWTGVELPRLAREARADVIHHPLPAYAPATRIPQVLTVHDLAFERLPELFDRRFRIYAHHAHRAAARAAGGVICVSETTAADVEMLWRVSRDRVVVARHGPGQEPSAPRREPRHFLYVGDEEPRKNLATLLTAYSLYREAVTDPFDLVLAGAASANRPGVRTEPAPDAGRLAALYAEAAALVQPSLYEGFGLTALEAMSAGAPVLAADSPGLTELCGDAARYAAAKDPRSFAVAMAEIAQSRALQAELSAAGIRRAAGFSWAASASAHATAYSLSRKRA